jgi:hypothetical protein
MIDREFCARQIAPLVQRYPVVAILSVGQVGKSTLANSVVSSMNGSIRFDLENSADVARLADPTLAGRISYRELPGLGLRGIPRNQADRLWVRGGRIRC